MERFPRNVRLRFRTVFAFVAKVAFNVNVNSLLVKLAIINLFLYIEHLISMRSGTTAEMTWGETASDNVKCNGQANK